MSDDKPGHGDKHSNIQIDREHFQVDKQQMTGAELRQLPAPPIPAERDLYQVQPGDDDLLIGDADVVTMRSGLRFFTVPGQINPGSHQ